MLRCALRPPRVIADRMVYYIAFSIAVPSGPSSLKPVLVLNLNGYYIALSIAVPSGPSSLKPVLVSKPEWVLYCS